MNARLRTEMKVGEGVRTKKVRNKLDGFWGEKGQQGATSLPGGEASMICHQRKQAKERRGGRLVFW